MRNLFTLILFLTTFSFAFSQTRKDTLDDTEKRPFQLGVYENTSLISLIATPEKYNEKKVQVIGYLHLEFEGTAIYFHKEDYEKGILENSFWVNFSDKLAKKKSLQDYSDKYVIIIGTFKMKDKGHLGLFSGTIDNIVRLDAWMQ